LEYPRRMNVEMICVVVGKWKKKCPLCTPVLLLKIYRKCFPKIVVNAAFGKKKWFGIICKFWKQNLLVSYRLAALMTWCSLEK